MRVLVCVLTFLIAFLIPTHVKGQEGSEEVVSAFEQMDSEAISSHFKDHVQLDICSKSGVYSQTQAKHILDEWFRKHSAANFNIKHIGRSDKHGHYCVGTYTEKSHTYRVTYLLDPHAGGAIIRNLSILEIDSR